jgi:hypothetical protein
MMQQLIGWVLLGVVGVTAVTTAQVRPPSPGLTIAYPKVCKHGLYIQHRIGRYAVMLFCDDAQSSHIGVICYEPGCESPGDGPWGLTDRFWQEEEWASDVTAFAWDTNGECLYVSTGEIFGTGDLYALSLSKRRATKIARDPRDANGAGYSTELTSIDSAGKQLEYSVMYFDEKVQRETTVRRNLRLPACS